MQNVQLTQISRCCLISSPSLHSSSRTIRSSGLWTSSSSLLLVPLVPASLISVAPLTLPLVLFVRFFLNQLRLLLVLAASVSEVTDAAYSRPSPSTSVGSVLSATLRLEESFLRWLVSIWPDWSAGAGLGVGIGVVSVEGVDSTSSASRYHFRRRV